MDSEDSFAGCHLRHGRLSLVLAAILWSLAGVFIKFLSLHPLTIVFYRSFFASAFFLSFRGRSASVPRYALLLAMISYTAAISTFVAANKLTTAANAIVLQYTAPIFVFVLVRFLFHERIAGVNWMCLACGMSGILVIYLGSAGQPDAVGVVVALLSGAFFSFYMVSLRFLKAVHPGSLTFMMNLACWLILLPFVGSELQVSLREFAILAVMGIIQLGIPYWLFSKGLETVALQEASLIVLIEPVLNPLWVAVIVGEIPSKATLTGGALIIVSLGVRYVWQRFGRSVSMGAG